MALWSRTTTATDDEHLTSYGLTNVQYRRAAAAHELGHALAGVACASLDTHSVELSLSSRQAHGVTRFSTAPGYTGPDPEDRALSCFAGPIAQAKWLQEQERVWTATVQRLVHNGGENDRRNAHQLGLGRRELDRAQRDAAHLVNRQWRSLVIAVPRLVKSGRLTRSEIQRLAR